MIISLVHPSRQRVDTAREAIREWKSHASGAHSLEHVLSVDEDDPELDGYRALAAAEGSRLVVSHNRTMVEAANRGAAAATGDLIVSISDDFGCPKDWDTSIAALIGDRPEAAMIVSDGIDSRIMTLPILTRAFYQRIGYVYHPAYISMFADDDLTEVCRHAGVLIDARPQLVFPHRHASQQLSAADSTHFRQNSNRSWWHGWRTFMKRRVDKFGPRRTGFGAAIARARVDAQYFGLTWGGAVLQGIRRAATGLVAIAAVLLIAVSIVRAYRLVDVAGWSITQLTSKSGEERRLEAYGDCDGRGYGYLKRVTGQIPESDFMPALRYHRDPGYAQILLPGSRRRSDPRVLVNLGVLEADLETVRLAAAPVVIDGVTSWQFMTGREIDSLRGIVIHPATAPQGEVSLSVTVFETPSRRRALGHWDVRVGGSGAGPWSIDLQPKLAEFSRSRGALPFTVVIDGPLEISRVEMLGRPVDVDGYREVHREGDCATYVREDFLSEINRGAGAWASWLAGLQQQASR